MITIKDVTSYEHIPEHMKLAMTEYIESGRPVGSFLEAILTNNLKKAVANADDTNICIIPAYVKFLYNEAPSGCWGSPANYQHWLDYHASKRNQVNQMALEL